MRELPRRPLVVSTDNDPSPEFYQFAEPGRALIVSKHGIAIRGTAKGIHGDRRSRLLWRSLVLLTLGIVAICGLAVACIWAVEFWAWITR